MCGIAGFVGSGTRDQLEFMGNSIRRRGPDDEGFFEAPGVGFAFRRLSIIDVHGGHQPLSNDNGSVWVMLNGEIYGFEKLRNDLISRGHCFAAKSDTEVIVHAYEEGGQLFPWKGLDDLAPVFSDVLKGALLAIVGGDDADRARLFKSR